MERRNNKISEEVSPFPGHRSYSIADIIAAGGATAFANKMGKSPESIGSRLKALPKDAFLTEEEASEAIKMLSEGK
ncbi:MAG: hypothetical protein ABI367_07205 [Mucilaginibacter sp.]